MISAYRRHGSIAKAAAELGCSYSTLRYRLVGMGVDVTNRVDQRLTAADAQRLADLYRRGLTLRDLADIECCGEETMRRLFRRHGFRLRSVGNPTTRQKTLRRSVLRELGLLDDDRTTA